MLALEKNLRGSTWFRTPLEQAGLLSRRGVASAARWSLCRYWSEAARRSGFDAAREAKEVTPGHRQGGGGVGGVVSAAGAPFRMRPGGALVGADFAELAGLHVLCTGFCRNARLRQRWQPCP